MNSKERTMIWTNLVIMMSVSQSADSKKVDPYEKWDEFLENDFKQTKAAERKAHFAKGGSAKSWKRSSQILDEGSSKARKNKKSCRDWEEDEL
jgi:hypothetical protein